MANKYKNEMEIKIGEETILLRPTFENLSDMESNVGGLAYLAWRLSRGTTIEDKVKSLPSFTDMAKIIYYNQAARKADDPSLRKLSLEEIWELVQGEGAKLIKPVTEYLSQIMAGNKLSSEGDEKKE